MSEIIDTSLTCIAFVIWVFITGWFFYTGIKGLVYKTFYGSFFPQFNKIRGKGIIPVKGHAAIILSIRNLLFGIISGSLLIIVVFSLIIK